MTVTIAGIEFDHHHYDPGGDVLYLCVGAPRESGHGLETPEGHAVEYDAAWNVTWPKSANSVVVWLANVFTPASTIHSAVVGTWRDTVLSS